MGKTLHVVFDGEVLRPEGPVDLESNTRYVVTIEREEEVYPLRGILQMATDMGITDLSTRHSRYPHGRLENG